MRGSVLAAVMLLGVLVKSGYATSAGGTCSPVGSTTLHDTYCDQYYQCVITQTVTGGYHGEWIIRTCAPGTIWGTNGFCIHDNTGGTCAKSSTVTSTACTSVPCQQSAPCTNVGTNDYSCACPSSHSGKNCQTNIDDCAPNPCMQGAACTDLNSDYSCACPTGYTGKNCETAVSTTCTKTCQNGGTCQLSNGVAVCSCRTNFKGNNCQYDCDDQATCQSCTKAPECVCSGCPFSNQLPIIYKYSGVCDGFLWCQRTGTPGNYVVTYTEMVCGGGTAWDSGIITCNHYSDTILSECQACSDSPCKNGGTCTDKTAIVNFQSTSVGFSCACATGYSGRQCQKTP